MLVRPRNNHIVTINFQIPSCTAHYLVATTFVRVKPPSIQHGIPNYNNSYLYNSTWKNIDPTHFTPLVAIVVAGYSILYNNTQSSLENAQHRLRDTFSVL